MTGARPALTANASMRWSLVSRLLPTDLGDVLEVGCGQGAAAVLLARRCRTFVGIEPDAEAARTARARLNAAGMATARVLPTLDGLPLERRFDLVCAFEVLEHLEHDREAVTDWVKRVRPGGLVLVSVPAFAHRFGAADVLVGHLRRYDPADLVGLLREAGLCGVTAYQYGGPLGYALEAGRNHLARRRLVGVTADSPAERTARSGRWLQPRSGLEQTLIRLGTAPFRGLQRLSSGRGPGLVAVGRVP